MVPWGKRYLTFAIVALLAGEAAAAVTQDRHAAQVEVWDCQHPTCTVVYNGRTFCSSGSSSQFQQPAQDMAQLVTRHQAEGFKCEAVRTACSHICGAFSYEKALPSLTSTTQLQLSESDCCKMFFNGVFHNPETGHNERDSKWKACSISQLVCVESSTSWVYRRLSMVT